MRDGPPTAISFKGGPKPRNGPQMVRFRSPDLRTSALGVKRVRGIVSPYSQAKKRPKRPQTAKIQKNAPDLPALPRATRDSPNGNEHRHLGGGYDTVWARGGTLTGGEKASNIQGKLRDSRTIPNPGTRTPETREPSQPDAPYRVGGGGLLNYFHFCYYCYYCSLPRSYSK